MRRVKELVSAQPVEEGAQKWVWPTSSSLPTQRTTQYTGELRRLIGNDYSIKKPKTHRYPSLKGTDPKFRRNHRHALHGTARALKEVKEGKRDAV
jgi:hypothetical protein